MPCFKIIKQDILAMSEYCYLSKLDFSKFIKPVESIFQLLIFFSPSEQQRYNIGSKNT